MGARVARNIVRFREENFPITPANIHDIHKLRTSKRLLELIDFTDQPVHAKGSSLPTYQPQESFVQGLPHFMNDNQPNRMYSDDPQQSSLPATPVQAQVQPPSQLVGYPSQNQPTSQYQPTTLYQPMAQHQSMSQYQPTTQYQPMAQHQPTAQYQSNQFPVMRQKPTRHNTAEPSKPPVLPKK